MEELSKKVRKLLWTADERDRYFLGRRPSEREIKRQLENLDIFNKSKHVFGDPKDIFKEDGPLHRQRIPMGEYYSERDEILGYNGFILLNKAKPTEYEKQFMGMGNCLKYLFMKTIFVHPDHRGHRIGKHFVSGNIELANMLGKHPIIDVEKDNYHMINILVESDFYEDFKWEDSKGKRMIRYFHE